MGNFILLMCLFCTSISSCGGVKESHNFFYGEEVLQNAYGICFHYSDISSSESRRDSVFKRIDELQIDLVRTDLYWHAIQANSNSMRTYKHFDELFESLKKYDLRLLPILDYSLPEFPEIWNHINEWSDYVLDAVSRYASNVDYWEIWNEENLPHFWQGKPSPVHYMALLKKTSSIIRKKDPNSEILIGGLAGVDEEYLGQILKKGYRFFDVVNFHYYNNPQQPPEDLIEKLEKLNEVLEKYHCMKKVWITETGYSTYPNDKMKSHGQVSEQEQAIRLPRIFLIAFCYGIEKVFWYDLVSSAKDIKDKEFFFGIVDKNLQPKKAFYSYKTLVKMLPNNCARPSFVVRDNVYTCTWKTETGKCTKAMWMPYGKKKVKVNGECYDVYGQPLASDSVTLSPSIVYVRSN